jgi:transcriptional regulator with XRE-family HTH domain
MIMTQRGKKQKNGVRSVTPADKAIGNRLRALRLDRGISQQAVADELGLSFQQIQKYEKGTNRLAMVRAQQLAAFFRVGVEQLITVNPVETTGEHFDVDSYMLARSFRLLSKDVKNKIRNLIEAITDVR